MGSRCPTLRKSPSTLPHRRAFWAFEGEWGRFRREPSAWSARHSRCCFAVEHLSARSAAEYTTRGRGNAPARRKRPKTDNEWREAGRKGACFDASARMGLRMPLLNLRAGHKNTAAFSQIKGDFAEKQRCFWSALWSAEQNGRRAAEQVGAKGANLGQCGHNM